MHQLIVTSSASPHPRLFACPRSVAKILAPDGPVQCFSENQVCENAQAFVRQFGPNTAYAVKANPHPNLLKTVYRAGIRVFDVASIAEMDLVHTLFARATLHYHNPVKSYTEIANAYHHYGCRRFAVDDEDELQSIATVARNDPQVEIAVRFRLPAQHGAIHDFSSKFGTAPHNAARLLTRTKLHGYKPVLTFHPGSQCTQAKLWCLHITAAAQIAEKAGIKLHKLNIGGGFPANYPKSKQPDLQAMFDKITQTAFRLFGPQAQNLLECEPGRAIAASGITALAQVKRIRATTSELFLNDGIYGNLLEMTQASELTPQIRVIRDGNYLENTDCRSFTIYGPTCDPLDRLPGVLPLPGHIAPGDYLEFKNLGAYANATATRFNGYGSCELVHVERP